MACHKLTNCSQQVTYYHKKALSGSVYGPHVYLIYIFDSVHTSVPYGWPQHSVDLDQIWHAASL